MSRTSTRPLGELACYVRGITFKPKDKVPPSSSGAVVCMRTKNIQVELDQSDLIAVPKSIVKRREQYLQPRDILVSSANSWNLVGKCVRVPELDYLAAAGGFISILRPDEERVDPDYLYRWLSAPRTQLTVRHLARQTTNIANLSAARFLELPVPVPSRSEQRRVSALLDKADALRQKREETTRLSEDFLRSAFLEMFGDPYLNPRDWGIIQLAELLLEKPRIGTTKPAHEGGRQRVVRVGELGGSFVALNDCGSVTLEGDALAKYRVAEGDLLLARAIGSEAHLGKASLLPQHEGDIVFDSHVMRLRFDREKCMPEFFLVWLSTPGGRAQFMKRAGRTAVQFNVNAKQISSVEVPLPPVDLLETFVLLFRSVQNHGARLARAATEADLLSRALTEDAFAGAI